MKKINLYLLLFFVNTFLYGQQQTTKTNSSKLVFGFSKVVQGKTKIISPLNGGFIRGSELTAAKNIFCYYKTAEANKKVDSIFYTVYFTWPVRRDPIELEGKQFEIDKKSNTGEMIQRASKMSGTTLLFKVNKIVLENGEQLLNPPVENNNSYKNTDSYLRNVSGVLYTVKN